MISNSRAAYHLHDHRRCVGAALAEARHRCAAARARLTPIREAVLRLIWESHRPVGAYQILRELPRHLGRSVQPPTVYRAIDFLVELGLVHRIATLNAYLGCPFPGREHSELFLICNQCGATAEVGDEALNAALAETVRKAGFRHHSQRIEITGLCPACAEQS
ncbi:MAG: Fur family transcriptional regulator [Porticoccaceae bacterium]|nr:MAG: Fur family transcriptional regulator [Porticoccaceae bacterium]